MPYIHPTESDPIIRQKLKRYVHVPIEDVNVFMKAEGLKANSVRYHKLDLQKSLRDNLRNKILIEYPLLHVVLSDHWNDFPLKEPAEPASANDKYATKGVPVDHASEDLALCSPSLPRSHTTRGNVFTAMRSSPESLPPQEKRRRRELGEEELEEGEIAESEDEEDHGETIGKNSTLNQTCDGATSKDELVDEGTGNLIKDLSSVVNSKVSMTE
ncbi:uncharacterized protein LOC127605719 [Hippocampus zosterae]|uniref:uncharacterized protein LOC127605719 n=1 Tax=Hippocampus zosterae TaxID=109293 RepID=UPI00223DC84D|nr:uncharacterized protein LOC127605719 [Hippocampus zosterae]